MGLFNLFRRGTDEDEDDPDRIDPEDPSTWWDKPYCCKVCDGPYPDCADSCSILDD